MTNEELLDDFAEFLSMIEEITPSTRFTAKFWLARFLKERNLVLHPVNEELLAAAKGALESSEYTMPRLRAAIEKAEISQGRGDTEEGKGDANE
jgi:hypothetical protein